MTKDKTVTMSREPEMSHKIELGFDYADGKHIPTIKISLEPCGPDGLVWDERDMLGKHIKKILAAPIVEAGGIGEAVNPVVDRQDPVGRVSYIGSGFVRVRTTECLAMEQPLYASQPAPVSVSVAIDERAAFDAWAVKHGRVVGYNGWRNDFEVWQARACLENLKELNQ